MCARRIAGRHPENCHLRISSLIPDVTNREERQGKVIQLKEEVARHVNQELGYSRNCVIFCAWGFFEWPFHERVYYINVASIHDQNVLKQNALAAQAVGSVCCSRIAYACVPGDEVACHGMIPPHESNVERQD